MPNCKDKTYLNLTLPYEPRLSIKLLYSFLISMVNCFVIYSVFYTSIQTKKGHDPKYNKTSILRKKKRIKLLHLKTSIQVLRNLKKSI